MLVGISPPSQDPFATDSPAMPAGSVRLERVAIAARQSGVKHPNRLFLRLQWKRGAWPRLSSGGGCVHQGRGGLQTKKTPAVLYLRRELRELRDVAVSNEGGLSGFFLPVPRHHPGFYPNARALKV